MIKKLEICPIYGYRFTMSPQEAIRRSPVKDAYCKLNGANPGFLYWCEGDSEPHDGFGRSYSLSEVAHLRWRPSGKEEDWLD